MEMDYNEELKKIVKKQLSGRTDCRDIECKFCPFNYATQTICHMVYKKHIDINEVIKYIEENRVKEN